MAQIKHGLSHGYANFIAKEATKDGPAASTPDGQVDAQYAGNKAALRPLYEKLIETASALGEDIEIAPKKANVSIRRNKQFALFQPTTQTRIDVGLILKDVKPAAAWRPQAASTLCSRNVYGSRTRKTSTLNSSVGSNKPTTTHREG